MIDKFIALFEEYDDNAVFGDPKLVDMAKDFRDRFRELICECRGHNIIPDRCGRPEHYYCDVCMKLLENING